MNKIKAYWLLQFLGWTVYACLHIVLLIISKNFDSSKVFEIVAVALYYLVSTHLFREFIKVNGWLKENFTRLVLKVFVASFLLAISTYCFQVITYFFAGLLDPAHDFGILFISVSVFTAMVFYFLWSLIYVLYHYLEQRNQTLKYQATTREFELNRLRAQMNPHFIFNALNSIRALVEEEPEDAKKAITQLSGILRNSLVINRKKVIKLKDELETVRDYLALEKIRYEERLSFDFDIDSDTLQAKIPPLMIQTLVENGIKHGIGQLTEGGFLTIKSRWNQAQDILIFSIWNSGALDEVQLNNAKGSGIANTTQRLELLYGEQAKFEIKNDQDGVLTTLYIPQKLKNYENTDY
ncbi:sensor histidine kinase [Persicobacter psychrovividus]|uniref:Histidine kinase n=1 Tax=Persicobacter psychrovividus TaxID=387638 RepID=A0ABN6LAL3_9BACT|nr:histidine kinase [Persicobacter psychrovividus]